MMATLPIMTTPARAALERGNRASSSQALLSSAGIVRAITVAPRAPDCAREVPSRAPWSRLQDLTGRLDHPGAVRVHVAVRPRARRPLRHRLVEVGPEFELRFGHYLADLDDDGQ